MRVATPDIQNPDYVYPRTLQEAFPGTDPVLSDEGVVELIIRFVSAAVFLVGSVIR